MLASWLLIVRDLLQERSFADLSVSTISERAGVARSGFYFYFDSKYAVLAVIVAEAEGQAGLVCRTGLHGGMVLTDLSPGRAITLAVAASMARRAPCRRAWIIGRLLGRL